MIPEDKENNGCISNKMKTPTNKKINLTKEEKSPLNLKIKERRVETTHCLTPKDKLTPKGKNDKSGFKAQRSDLTEKKETKDSSTVKKRTGKDLSLVEHNTKGDRLKYY